MQNTRLPAKSSTPCCRADGNTTLLLSRCVAVLLPAPGRDYRRIMQADGGGTTRRLRSASREDAEVDELVEVIVGKLAATGYLDRPGATPAPPAVKTEEADGWEVQRLPSATQQRQWMAHLRQQQGESRHYGTREKEEVRGLLIISESGGPPLDHVTWFWGRVRMYLIIAHEGWPAAIRDARGGALQELGIAIPTDQAPGAGALPLLPLGAARGRGRRPSQPAGLRRPSRTPGPCAPPPAARSAGKNT